MNSLNFQARVFNLKTFFSFVSNKSILNKQKCVLLNFAATIKDFPDPPVTEGITYLQNNFFYLHSP